MTGRGFVERIGAPLGRPVKVTATSQGERPFVVDASKFQGAFGPLAPTPHPRAVATTVAWFQQRAGRTRR